MFWFKQKPFTETFKVQLNNTEQKVVVYYENRSNSRVSIGKKSINIRLPLALNDDQRHQQIKKFLSWAETKLSKRAIVNNGNVSRYTNNSTLELYDRKIKLQINLLPQGSDAKASLKENVLTISLSEEFSDSQTNTICSELTTKLLRKAYQQKIERKLHFFNDKFKFGTINTIRLKNNATNWGSCSSKGNINVSLRLLLAPEAVVNYVLIHELAHLKQPNHSKHFWDLVAASMPTYKQKEQWLKENSHLCVL